MSKCEHEYILTQSSKRTVDKSTLRQRIDLSIARSTVFNYRNTEKSQTNALKSNFLEGEVVVVIKNNYELVLANTDVNLYRGGANKSLIPVHYCRTDNEGIHNFVNNIDYFKKK